MNKNKKHEVPFREWLDDVDRRIAKCNEYFKAVFDFMDFKIERQRSYK